MIVLPLGSEPEGRLFASTGTVVSQLVSQIAAWEKQRNKVRARIKWMFTVERARTKLARAYPAPAKES